MQHFRAKHIKKRNEKSKNSWSPSAEAEKLRQLELIIDEKISQRVQRWCRACASEHCCLEKPFKETQSVTSEDHATQLQAIRNRREDFENYLGRVDKLVSSCRYGILRARCHPAYDDQLPIWLCEVLGAGFTLPLVPTFPTSASAFETLCSGAGLRDLNVQIKKEYLEAASSARRLAVLIGGAQLKYKYTNSIKVLVTEEISQGYNRVDDDAKLQKSTLKTEQSKNESNHSFTKFLLETTSKILSNKDDLVKSEDYHGIMLQKLENQMLWTGAYCCTNAEIKECGQERALIVGQLRRPNLNDSIGESDYLPFKLILLLDDRHDRPSKRRVKGTLLRKSASSRFDLRWKFNVEVA